jgi:hypothetical protein
MVGLGNSYELYRKHRKWPCIHLVEAILNHAPGFFELRETVANMESLAHDFATFQDVFIRYPQSRIPLIAVQEVEPGRSRFERVGYDLL